MLNYSFVPSLPGNDTGPVVGGVLGALVALLILILILVVVVGLIMMGWKRSGKDIQGRWNLCPLISLGPAGFSVISSDIDVPLLE